MVADLFVMLFLVAMVLFIVYHFYIDYKNWSNTGNTFAEGFSANEEKLTGKGADYRGKQNKTISGKTCQKWNSQSPHKHNNTPEKKPNKGLGDHNFCRNPDGEPSIWCYTQDPNKRWELCEPLKAPQRNFSQIMQVNRQVQEQQMRNALSKGIDLSKAAGINQAGVAWSNPPPQEPMPKNIAEYVIGEIISKRLTIPPPGSAWANKLQQAAPQAYQRIGNANPLQLTSAISLNKGNNPENQVFNNQFDQQMAISHMQQQHIKQGQTLQGIPSSQPAASKMHNTAIFNEQLMKQVLSNKLLIPGDIKLGEENQKNYIRVGKNFMKDLSHIRNVAIPNIDNDDYESLGRVVSKIKMQEQQKITGPQNLVSKQKLINSVNNILSGTIITNSQVDWDSPQQYTKLRTTGMYGDNSNSMMGYGDKAEKHHGKPDGGLCMWKGCEKHPKKKPYDSVWSLY
tara:strand:+ start:937 stop:2298 length:1362 start_codon:yes stop_codon:yes gene_type:complete